MPVSFTPTTITNPQGVQGAYPLRLPAGHEGLIADLRSYDTYTAVNQTGAALPIGALVKVDNATGRAPEAVTLADAADTQLIRGIVTDQYTFEQGGTYSNTLYNAVAADGRPGIPDDHSLNVMTRGVIWVYSAHAIVLGDSVRFFRDDYSGTLAGAFQARFGKTAVNGDTVLATSGFRWMSETAAPGLVQLSFDMNAAVFVPDEA